jgi:hypothetical protein
LDPFLEHSVHDQLRDVNIIARSIPYIHPERERRLRRKGVMEEEESYWLKSTIYES